jgi:hypothetical protein
MPVYAELSEMMYLALQEVEKARMSHNGPETKFDLSFLIDIALDNNDKDLFDWCVENG